MERDVLEALIDQHPILRTLEPAERGQLADTCDVLCVERGDTLYEVATPAVRLLVLLEGAIQVEYPAAEGEIRGAVAATMRAPCVLGEAQLMNDKDWSGTGVAITPLIAIGISRPKLESLIVTAPLRPRALPGPFLEVLARHRDVET